MVIYIIGFGVDGVLAAYGVHEGLVGENTTMKASAALLAQRRVSAFEPRLGFMGGFGICRLSIKNGLGFRRGL